MTSLVKGSYRELMFEVLSKLWDRDVLDECLFEDFAVVEEDAAVDDDRKVAKSMLDTVRTTMSSALLVGRNYSCRPPWRFLGLIDPDVEFKRETVTWCKLLREALFLLPLRRESHPDCWQGDRR